MRAKLNLIADEVEKRYKDTLKGEKAFSKKADLTKGSPKEEKAELDSKDMNADNDEDKAFPPKKKKPATKFK